MATSLAVFAAAQRVGSGLLVGRPNRVDAEAATAIRIIIGL